MSRGPRSRARWAVAALIACGALISAAPATASVTIGATFPPDDEFGDSGVFIQSGSLNDSYTVPADGVVTSWSFEAPAGVTPPLKLKMMRFAGGSDFTTVGDSALESPMPGVLNTWPTRIAVQTGDVPAHFYSDSTISYRSNVPGYTTNEIFGVPGDPALDPPPGTTVTYEETSPQTHQIDLSAVIEPDADRDAFGDETQDQCLGTPGVYAGCPSSFELVKITRKGSAKIGVKLQVPGAGTVAVGSPGDKSLASASAKPRSLKAKRTTETVTGTHGVFLRLKLTRRAAQRLASAGKLKVKVKAVYTPPGGPPASIVATKKLKS